MIRDPRQKFESQALLSTDSTHTAEDILCWFVRRWRMEVTFEESRAHLGVETQRQWNEQAIARMTPALLALFSLVTLMADGLQQTGEFVRTAAWYRKKQATFSDAIALVRRRLWSQNHFSMSGSESEVIKIPRVLFDRLTDVICYAA